MTNPLHIGPHTEQTVEGIVVRNVSGETVIEIPSEETIEGPAMSETKDHAREAEACWRDLNNSWNDARDLREPEEIIRQAISAAIDADRKSRGEQC